MTVKIKAQDDDWAEPKRNERGQQIAPDGFPIQGIARARALAEAGKKTDDTGAVSDEQIAAFNPAAAEADRKAVAAFHAEQAEKALAAPPADETKAAPAKKEG